VKINNEHRKHLILTHSVPQGNVLRSWLIFTIDNNGILNLNIKGKIICYADDRVSLKKIQMNYCSH